MDSRAANIIMGLITVSAIGFAVYLYLSKQTVANPVVTASVAPQAESSPVTSPTASANLFTTPTPKPGASTSPSPSPATAARTFTASQALTLPNEQVTIAQGDSLFGIAQSHSIATNDLAKLNGVGDVNSVRIGQKLIVPDDVNSNTFTILFVLNPLRLAKEKASIANGASSLYADALSAAQTETKGIYGLKADTPYSQPTPATDADKTATLSTSDADKVVTISLEKQDGGVWAVKKLVIKLTTP